MKALVVLKKQMNARFINLLVLLILVACSTPPKKIQKPFYWTAQFQGKTFHILGTMHAGFSIYSLPEKIRNDIIDADIVAMEVTPALMKESAKVEYDKSVQYLTKAKDYYPDLKSKLEPLTWKHLYYTLEQDDVKKYLHSLQINHESNHLHPAIVTLVTYHFINKKANYVFHPDLFKRNTKYSSLSLAEEKRSIMDSEIISFVEANKIPLIALDTLKLVSDAMTSVKGDVGIKLIEKIYGNGADSRDDLKELNEIQKIYQSGNEEAMAKYLSEVKEMEGPLLTKRNASWYKTLTGLKEKNIFVAVGTLHLVGEKSLLKLFEKAGAKVSRQN